MFLQRGVLQPRKEAAVNFGCPPVYHKYSIERQIADYRNSYHWNASCQGSVPAAIRCFLESDCYESFLRNVFSLRCDMDTLCAICGGIAEELYNGTGLDNENV